MIKNSLKGCLNVMDLKKYLGQTVSVVIDRPIGAKHPRYPDLIYEVNYGYLPNTINSDGAGIDVYVLDGSKPISRYKGRVVAIIHRLDDDDDKLIVSDNHDITDEEIEKLIDFQEKYFKHEIIR